MNAREPDSSSNAGRKPAASHVMSNDSIKELASREYQHGFVTEIEEERIPSGLSEDVVRLISSKKNEPEWMLEWRLKAYRHWLTIEDKEPTWARITYPKIDYQDMTYYSAPKSSADGPKSLADVDPELLKMYEKLGVPLHEQALLAGVAVDAVFDSVSVGTTYKAKLASLGIIFCSFSEAVLEHPDLVQKYLGSVVLRADCCSWCFALRSSLLALCFPNKPPRAPRPRLRSAESRAPHTMLESGRCRRSARKGEPGSRLWAFCLF